MGKDIKRCERTNKEDADKKPQGKNRTQSSN
jgi:hypothetical protein